MLAIDDWIAEQKAFYIPPRRHPRACRAGAEEQKHMTEDAPVAANMSQRAVLQYLSLTEWKVLSHLPVPAGLVMIDRIRDHGWIELRGMKPRTEIRLTELGLAAMRAPLAIKSKKIGGSSL
jgi:hypothetical protein